MARKAKTGVALCLDVAIDARCSERHLGNIEHDVAELYRHMNYHQITEGKEHVALGRALLHSVRNLGIHVMVVPFGAESGYPEGQAFCLFSDDTGALLERHISMSMAPDDVMFFHVLLHEWVHHMMGHCDVWTSAPEFVTEYTTERKTLEIAKQLASESLLTIMAQQAKAYILKIYQNYADFVPDGIHLSTEIADWCGYKMSKKARRTLVEREAKWNRESKTSLTSSELSQLPF